MEVAVAIVFERRSSAMVSVAIGLDDQAMAAPEEVDLEAAKPDVYLRRRQVVPLAEAQEGLLQLAAGGVPWHLFRKV